MGYKCLPLSKSLSLLALAFGGLLEKGDYDLDLGLNSDAKRTKSLDWSFSLLVKLIYYFVAARG